jgi:hypothetical protein
MHGIRAAFSIQSEAAVEAIVGAAKLGARAGAPARAPQLGGPALPLCPSAPLRRHPPPAPPPSPPAPRARPRPPPGAFFGTFLGGALMLRYGRRRAIAAQGVFFCLGPVLMAAAPGPW